MKTLERLIILAGLATMAGLLWKLDAAAVWAHASQVGWGIALLMPLQLLDQGANALGWRCAFPPEDARRVGFWPLLRARVAGDGVNYLTPSATIGGELVRPAMLGEAVSEESRILSVVVAKFTQALAQALFTLLGLAFILGAKIPLIDALRRGARWYAALSVLAFAALAVYGAIFWRRGSRESPSAGPWEWRPGAVRQRADAFIREFPGRFAFSIAFFGLGYLFGALEVYVLCRLLDAPVTWSLAVAIEVLSTLVDGVLFMVPAKIGTQEAGKTAIFTGLGLSAAQGFAFGLIRHVRELAWAGAGFWLYAADKRARQSASAQKEADQQRGALLVES